MRESFRISKKGIIGIEAAIILIAFVIISAAFAFMSINMGLFATQRSKDTIAQGLREASSPLQVDGSILIRVKSNELTVNSTIIPLRAMGVKYVPVGREETVVSLTIVDRAGNSKAFSNIYYGVVDSKFDPTGKSYNELAKMAEYYVDGKREIDIYSGTDKKVKIRVDDNIYEYSYTTSFNNVTITVEGINVKIFETEWGAQSVNAENGIATIEITSLSEGWNDGLLTVDTPGEYIVTIKVYADDREVQPSLSGIGSVDSVSFKLYKVRNFLPSAVLIVDNSDGDEALDASEKGFLVVLLGEPYKAMPRAMITVEIRVERSAPLTVEFMVPESLTENSWMIVTG